MATFGDTTAGGDTFPCSGDRGCLSRFTCPEVGTITAIWVRFDATSTAGANAKALLYTNNAGVPGTLVVASSGAAVPAGGGLQQFVCTGALTAQDYWIGAVTDSFQSVFQCDASGGGSRMEGVTYASPAATWTESGTTTAQFNAYVEYTPGGGVSYSRLLYPTKVFLTSN